MFQWVRNSEGRLVKVNFPQEPDSGQNFNIDEMEHPEGEQHSQYLVERNPNAYRSMRDYMYPPWVSVSCQDPGPTRMADPNRVRGARLYIGTLYFLFQTLVVPSLITVSKYCIQNTKYNYHRSGVLQKLYTYTEFHLLIQTLIHIHV